VTDPSAVITAAVHRFIDDLGGLDVLVNNAGIGILGPVETLPESAWRQVMETDFFGALTCMRAVLPHMRQRRRGLIINVSSASGRFAGPGFGAYAAAKFALEAVSEALRLEMSPYGVKVTVIEPGNYRTHIATAARQSSESLGPETAEVLYPALMEDVAAFLEQHGETSGDPLRLPDSLPMSSPIPRRRFGFRSAPWASGRPTNGYGIIGPGLGLTLKRSTYAVGRTGIETVRRDPAIGVSRRWV